MPFHAGRITFCRFRITGDAPTSVDDTALSILREHAFRETEVGAPDEVEVGWTTGQHLLDTQFTYEKNGFGDAGSGGGAMLLAAMRIDTHKVPADVKQAYRQINEQAAASGNPSGYASKAQKQEASELAGRQIHEDLAAGKYRKSKLVPVLWDLRRGALYCGATGNVVQEQLARLLRASFAVELEPLSAGSLAGDILRSEGRRRDWEDLHPSPFTPAPPEAHAAMDDADAVNTDPTIPTIPWRAQAVDLKDFLGNEWLIWLWHLTETAEGVVSVAGGGESARSGGGGGDGGGEAYITIDRSLDMDCAWGVRGKQTLRTGVTAGPISLIRLPEAGEALVTGKWPRKLGLILADAECQWELTLQGDRLHVSSAALPEVADAQTPRELTEARLMLVQRLAATLDGMYATFLDERTSSAWPTRRETIAAWIRHRRIPAIP
ncbi:MAG: hypothetical protein WD009_10860, partial [Phycisphaeraceae bacterium]